jgi:hypothetical protein
MATPPAKANKPAANAATPAAAPGAATPAAGAAAPAANPQPGMGRANRDDKNRDDKDKDKDKGASARSQGTDDAKQGRRDFKERLEALRKDRKERRHARRDALIRLWGKATLEKPPVREELEHHAWRMARLERMKTLLAESDHKQKAKLLARIDKLMERETARHKKHMDRLQSDTGATAAGSPGTKTGATHAATPAAPGKVVAKSPPPTAAQPPSQPTPTPAGGAQ